MKNETFLPGSLNFETLSFETIGKLVSAIKLYEREKMLGLAFLKGQDQDTIEVFHSVQPDIDVFLDKKHTISEVRRKSIMKRWHTKVNTNVCLNSNTNEYTNVNTNVYTNVSKRGKNRTKINQITPIAEISDILKGRIMKPANNKEKSPSCIKDLCYKKEIIKDNIINYITEKNGSPKFITKKISFEKEKSSAQKENAKSGDLAASRQAGGTTNRVEGESPSEGSKIGENWRLSYSVYLDALEDAYKTLLSDKPWLAMLAKYYPNSNIPLSLEKAKTTYWATKDGWAKKKAYKRGKTIDWKRTFTNSLSISCNLVRKTNLTNKTAYDNQSVWGKN